MLELTKGGRVFRAWRVAAAMLPCLPVLNVVALISRYGVNVPFADEFALAPLLVKAHQHALTFSDLFAQHNEHRYFFPGLLFIAIAFCAQGNLRAEMFFSVFLTLLASANLWLLLRKTTSLSNGPRVTVLFLFNLLLFSPVQAENWTWGYQLPLFLTNYLFTCAVLAAFSSLNLGRKFALCAALAFIATFSFGGGVVLWGLTFPWGLLSPRTHLASQRLVVRRVVWRGDKQHRPLFFSLRETLFSSADCRFLGSFGLLPLCGGVLGSHLSAPPGLNRFIGQSLSAPSCLLSTLAPWGTGFAGFATLCW